MKNVYFKNDGKKIEIIHEHEDMYYYIKFVHGREKATKCSKNLFDFVTSREFLEHGEPASIIEYYITNGIINKETSKNGSVYYKHRLFNLTENVIDNYSKQIDYKEIISNKDGIKAATKNMLINNIENIKIQVIGFMRITPISYKFFVEFYVLNKKNKWIKIDLYDYIELTQQEIIESGGDSFIDIMKKIDTKIKSDIFGIHFLSERFLQFLINRNYKDEIIDYLSIQYKFGGCLTLKEIEELF